MSTSNSTGDSLELPMACINRIIKAALPEHSHMGKDARVAFSRAAAVFILYLTSTALEMTTKDKRSSITGKDVVRALEEIEFSEFIGPLQEMAAAHAERTKKKPKKEPSITSAVEEEEDKKNETEDVVVEEDDEEVEEEEGMEDVVSQQNEDEEGDGDDLEDVPVVEDEESD